LLATREDPLALAEKERLAAKVRAKFGALGEKTRLVCDSYALEQATAPDIAQWKAAFWPEGSSLNDLCCGMGADSFFVKPSVRTLGVDLEESRVRMYQANMEILGLPHQAVRGDACSEEFRADFFCIDPARRPKLQPSFESVLQIAGRYQGGMAKLPPAFPVERLPANAERLYLGGRADCRETLLFLGSLAAHPERVRAVEFEGDLVRVWEGSVNPSPLLCAPVGTYLLEPSPVLVRSHLFLELGKIAHFWQIDATLSYLSCDALPADLVGFAPYRILGKSALATRAVKEMLAHHDIGSLDLKKRGVEVVPEEEIKRLKPAGTRHGILFYTRELGKKVAYLAERVSANSS
jgi:hypothetical protein